jgi:hypothetical protein
MAAPREKLANALEALKKLQERGVVALRAADLSRAHRERLLKNGFLKEVMKGWYVAASPGDAAGESTDWYASFWAFCAAYLRERFGSAWCLSPEQSLSLHTGNYAVPPQLVVRTPRGGNKATALPHGTSLLDIRAAVPEKKDIEEKDGLRLFSLPAALIASSPGFFDRQIAATTMIMKVSDSKPDFEDNFDKAFAKEYQPKLPLVVNTTATKN